MVLSQAEENKTKAISLGISLLIFLLLLLFLIFYIIITPNPPFPEAPGGGGGIEFNIGNFNEGTGNVENVSQTGGATYGRHIWENDNTIDVYQNGTHTFNMDVHVSDVEVDLWQEGTGSHYAHVYFYGTSDGSISNVMQKGSGNHNAQIQLQGSYPTTLNLLQEGSTNKSYTLTQNCQTTTGCSVSVTQQ